MIPLEARDGNPRVRDDSGSRAVNGASLARGDLVDRYEILDWLGSGGMGEVYRARDPKLERLIALKIMRPDRGPGADGAARLLREARAIAALSHPNVLAVYDVGVVQEPAALRGVGYIAMELVDGRSLRSFVGDKSVPMVRRVEWARDIARALLAAHEAGIVHRDMKPENVMIRFDGVVKVLDFGIARRTAASPDLWSSSEGHALSTFKGGDGPTAAPPLTGEGALVGTPLYMAPEQLRGEPLDARADQFSWGVVAYEILTGNTPWPRLSEPLAVVAAILSAVPRAPNEADEGVPDVAASVIMRSLEKEKGARFDGMRTLLEMLDGAHAPRLADPAQGEVLGPYVVTRLLGRGGMAAVFEAVHRELGRTVAIKILSSEVASDAKASARLLRESRLVSELRHPHIVQPIDLGTWRSRPYLVMELLDGGDLATYLRARGPLSAPEAVDILLPVLSAVATAHAHGIVHRDLKPSNILMPMVGSFVHPKVVDFGIARRDSDSDAGARSTRTGALLGTPEYMAPERFGDARSATAGSDVYSLGVVLYECVTGRLPFCGDDPWAIIGAALSRDPVPPARISPALPAAFEDVILKAIHRQPAARYESALDFGRALLPFATARSVVLWGEQMARPRTGGRTFEEDAAPGARAAAPSEGRTVFGRLKGALGATAACVLTLIAFALFHKPHAPDADTRSSSVRAEEPAKHEAPGPPGPSEGVARPNAVAEARPGSPVAIPEVVSASPSQTRGIAAVSRLRNSAATTGDRSKDARRDAPTTRPVPAADAAAGDNGAPIVEPD